MADGEGALEFGDGGVGGQGLPEGCVLGAGVGAGGEEEGGAAQGQVAKVAVVRAVGPGSAVEEVGDVVGEDDAHAGAVL